MLCSIQYMEQPEEVFAEIYRVLKPGGVVIITFSNRLFYEKAIAAWRDGSGYSRSQLVKSYFQAVSGFTQPEAVTEVRCWPPWRLCTIGLFIGTWNGTRSVVIVLNECIGERTCRLMQRLLATEKCAFDNINDVCAHVVQAKFASGVFSAGVFGRRAAGPQPCDPAAQDVLCTGIERSFLCSHRLQEFQEELTSN